jgi:hypothetical protein
MNFCLSNIRSIPVFLIFGVLLFAQGIPARPPAHPQHIYGIHSWGAGSGGLLQGKSGWTVEVVNTDDWPYDPEPADIQQMINEGWTPIIRINKFFGQTVPASSSEYDAFAQACAQKVQQYGNYCNIWIIGNEMNADFEGNIPVTAYIDVYTRCREAIKQVQPESTVLVAALGPWNASQGGVGPYPSNRPWLDYMYQLVHTLNNDCDGYAIHAYGGRGGDSDPRNDGEMAFGVYKKWMEILEGNAFARHKPVYLTEMNHAADGQDPNQAGFPLYDYPVNYIRLLYEEINTWNENNRQKIKAACWFSHANGGFPGYNISTNSDMSDDFNWVTRNTNYLNDNPTEVFESGWADYR